MLFVIDFLIIMNKRVYSSVVLLNNSSFGSIFAMCVLKFNAC